jgi:nicotinate-nucleotide pyrophosphorylase
MKNYLGDGAMKKNNHISISEIKKWLKHIKRHINNKEYFKANIELLELNMLLNEIENRALKRAY